jgi:CelD/BcsL family acetyltransferase involved in cellulose biosynthesis
MNIRRVTSLAELAPIATAWNRLTRGVPFRSWEWLTTWWEHYGHRRDGSRSNLELFVLCVEEDGELIAVAPWYIELFPLHGRVVQFLGSGPVCSDYMSVLCKPGWEGKSAAALAEWLSANAGGAGGPAAWDRIELDGIDAEDEIMRRLTDELNRCGSFVHCRPGMPCWRVALPGSWDEYLHCLSKSHRKELRALRRRMFDSGRATLRTARSPSELDEGWRTLIDLHQRRRRSLGDPGCFAAPRFEQFHSDVVRRLLPSGHLRLHWLELDGHPVAAEYHLAGDNGIVYAYQSGIEIDALGVAPGRLITLAILRQAIAEGYSGFDLLRGDEPYKMHWRAEPRPTVEICVLPGKGVDRFRYGMWLAGDVMRSWLRSRSKGLPTWLGSEPQGPWSSEPPVAAAEVPAPSLGTH